MIKRILVALDDSRRAPGVMDAAAELARRFAADLFLLRVLSLPPEFPPAAHVSHHDDLPAHLAAVARGELEALAARATGVTVATPVLLRSGPPWSGILEAADELQVDLIVIGSHGYKGFDRVLGTTAASVANQATCSVLVVHERPR